MDTITPINSLLKLIIMSTTNNHNKIDHSESTIQSTLEIGNKSITDEKSISAKNSIHDHHHHKMSTIFSFQPKVNQKFEYKDGKQINTATDKRKPSWLELLFDLGIVSMSIYILTRVY